jgi:hypothetical protein
MCDTKQGWIYRWCAGGYSLEENSGIPFLSCEATSNIILKRLIFEYTRFSNTQDLVSSARRDAGFPWGGA